MKFSFIRLLFIYVFKFINGSKNFGELLLLSPTDNNNSNIFFNCTDEYFVNGSYLIQNNIFLQGLTNFLTFQIDYNISANIIIQENFAMSFENFTFKFFDEENAKFGNQPKIFELEKNSFLFIKLCYFESNSSIIDVIFIYLRINSNLNISNFNCEESLLMNFIFIQIEDMAFININNAKFKKNRIYNTFFVSDEIIGYSLLFFTNFSFQENYLFNSNILKMGVFEVYINSIFISNNTFNESNFINFSSNQPNVIISIDRIFLQENVIQKEFIYFQISSQLIFNISLVNLFIILNQIEKNIIFSTNSFLAIQNIDFKHLLILKNNFHIKLLSMSSMLFKFVGSFKTVVQRIYFLYNICAESIIDINTINYDNNSLLICNSYFLNNLIFSINSDFAGIMSFTQAIQLDITKTLFVNNTIFYVDSLFSRFYFGCIVILSGKSNLSLNALKFINNTSTSGAVCLYFSGFSLNIATTIFYGNNVLGVGTQYGNIYIDSFVTKLRNTSFINSDCGQGSAIFSVPFNHDSVFISINLLFINNKATYSTVMFGSILTVQKIYLENIVFSNNTSYYGGALLIEGFSGFANTVVFHKNILFFNNSALLEAGCIEFRTAGINTYFINCIFLNSFVSSEDGGGGVMTVWGEVTDIILIKNCQFFNNLASYSSLFYIALSYFLILNSNITENSAINYLILVDSYSLMIINNSKVSFNDIPSSQMIRLQGRSKLFINSVSFHKNYFGKTGILLLITMAAQMLMKDVIFLSNFGEATGMILFIFNTYYDFPIKLQNLRFIDTSSADSMIYVASSILIIHQIIFVNNTNLVFFCFFSQIIIKNIEFQDHKCNYANINQGCFFQILSMIQGNNYSNVTNLYIENVLSSVPLFLLTSTNFSINNSSFLGVNSYIDIVFSVYESFLIGKKLKFLNFGSMIFEMSKTNMDLSASFFINTNKIKGNKLINSFNNDVRSPIVLFNCDFVNISYNIIKSNSGDKGGVIYSQFTNLSIIINYFINNTANFGGCIYYETNHLSINEWILYNNSFINSSATSAGGAFYWVYKSPYFELLNNFINNSAITGNDYSSDPLYLKFINNSNIFLIQNHYIPSQLVNFTFLLKDYYNQTIQYDTEIYAILQLFQINNIIPGTSFSFEGNTLIKLYEGYFNFSLLINVYPYSNFSLALKTDAIKDIDPNIYQYQNPSFYSLQNGYYYLLNFSSSECPLGYIFDKTYSSCTMCQTGKYSLNKEDKFCHDCPNNAICEKNGSFVDINPGYWRSGYLSINFYKCFRESACLGGDICKLNYEGRMCDNCILNENSQYFKGKNGVCESCKESLISSLGFIFYALVIFIYTSYIIRVNIKQVSIKSQTHQINITNVFFKILADYFQIISCLMNILSDWQDGFFSDLMIYIPNIVNIQGLLYPVDCWIYKIGTSDISIVYKRILLISLFSCISPFFFTLIWIIYSKIVSKSFSYQNSRKKLKISILIMCFLYQPTIINIYFFYQNCYEIDGKTYMKLDLNEICWKNNHIFFYEILILPFLCIWMFILPAILFLMMKTNIVKRRRSSFAKNKPEFHINVELKFFKEGYKNSTYYWEFVLLLKKYLFIIFTVFVIDTNSQYNFLICNWISFVFLFLQSFYQPYLQNSLNMLSLFSHFVIYSTTLILLMMTSFIRYDNVKFLLIYVIFTINSGFLIFWGILLFYLKKQNIYENIKKLKNFKGLLGNTDDKTANYQSDNNSGIFSVKA